jgi:hypothetical protein
MDKYSKILKRMNEYGWRDFSEFDIPDLISNHLERAEIIFEDTQDESLAFILDFMRALLEEK